MSAWRWGLGLCLGLGLTLSQAGEPRRAGGRAAALVMPDDVAALQRLSVLLGRPTDHSITLNLRSSDATEAMVEYGPVAQADPDPKLLRTAPLQLQAGEPRELELDGLQADQGYRYRLLLRAPGERDWRAGAEHRFHTQRAPGSAFSFQLQGDSHPERGHQFDAGMYAQTLRAAAAERPDFYLTMGDDFSVDTLHELNAATVAGRYLLQRPFLALVGQTAPLFLVNGNHEQAASANHDGSPDNVAVWAQTARNRLFPQPAPDGFYSGNAQAVAHIGLLRNYYAWTWGDALFVVIDPYWHSRGAADNELGSRDKKGRDLWNNTLGDAQYQWLRRTLQDSRARFKFVFAHHVLGTGRGGVEMAHLYEWGGRDRRGLDEFAQRRPGWPEPIHALMVRTGVNIFFQGHDHVFARQELDGVIYQTVPEPADPNQRLYFREAYRSGELLPNSGRVKVEVSPTRVRVSYLRSAPPGQAQMADPGPAFSYELKPRPVAPEQR